MLFGSKTAEKTTDRQKTAQKRQRQATGEKKNRVEPSRTEQNRARTEQNRAEPSRTEQNRARTEQEPSRTEQEPSKNRAARIKCDFFIENILKKTKFLQNADQNPKLDKIRDTSTEIPLIPLLEAWEELSGRTNVQSSCQTVKIMIKRVWPSQPDFQLGTHTCWDLCFGNFQFWAPVCWD